MTSDLRVGDERVVEIGVIAHGGHHIAHTDGATVFVRHAITGERVRIRVTSTSRKAVRADAIEILEASPDRVAAPCEYAHPDGCGGCDFQHMTLPAQRAAKETVVHDALRRFAGIDDLDVTVQELPGHPDGLHWRTRMQWSQTPDGRRGLRKHHSHDVVPIDECLIAAPGSQPARGGVFSQVHPALADALVADVLSAGPQPGQTWWDLYAGAGLFAAALAEHVDRVVAVESSPDATRAARRALHAMPHVEIVTSEVEPWLATQQDIPDGVVLDPPRSGAGRKVVDSLIRLAPPQIVYVACDPVALARDLAWFRAGGYHLNRLTTYDGFPMTHHIECVVIVSRPDREPTGDK